MRVNTRNEVNATLFCVINGNELSLQARLDVYNGIVVPSLIYRRGRWARQKKNGSRINEVEMRPLRSMCGVSSKDRFRNRDVREQCGWKEDVVTRVEKDFHINKTLNRIECDSGNSTQRLGGNATSA
ncbi:hypothetical protein EVAR_28229_1 [Eumeta japonica]|uniref:Uncharacterized protein n=1 Tax=Eumeta variegata TaxID=151549 RepID=A0A4C1V6Q0_EUMVA|nr:hypothetical protein EVAR_28229_1 [Eumeta japonica]